MKTKLPKQQELDIIRGKNLVGEATSEDVWKLFEYMDALEMFLDDADMDDIFGTQGWRYAMGLEE